MSATRSVPNVATLAGLQATSPMRFAIVFRLVAGLPLAGIAMVHLTDPALRMNPLVEAAGYPAPDLLAPLAVGVELVAGLSLLLGAFARVGAVGAIAVMLGAVYSHLAIDVWPNGAENEPPILLPLAVIACAAFVLWRGAGRWSIDARTAAE